MNESVSLRARFGPFHLDEAEARLSRAGMGVELPPRALAVLCELARRPGQLVPEEALLDRIWGHRHVSESVVRTVVSQLRQALGDDPRRPRYVETASRRGYRFIAEVVAERGSDAPPAASPTSSPAAGLSVPAPELPPLVGREAALQRLGAAWVRAAGGQRQLVFVGGEAGIGKSALVEHIVATLPSGVAVGVGQCVEHYGAAEPYMPILEALSSLCRSVGGDTLRATLRQVAPTWMLQMPWLLDEEDRRLLRQEAAGATQDRMLRELGELLDRARDASPLVILLEDLHWSDHATVQALAYLARRRGPSPVLVIGTFRPTELIVQQHPLAGLRHELKLHKLCEEIALEPLSERDLGDWLVRRLGARPPEDFVHALHAHTAGLPLFAAHLVDEWTQTEALAQVGGEWRLPDPRDAAVPGGIAHVIDRHVSGLTSDEQRLLGAASVGGLEFSSLCLAEVLDRDADDVAAALESLSERLPWLRVADVRPCADGRLDAVHVFRHSLYRHAIHQKLSVSQSVPWHRAWARALQRHHDGDPADLAAALALHFERGREPAAAAARLVDVAARAIERGAPGEAVRAARHGVALLAGAPDRACEQSLRLLEALALTRIHVVSEPEVAEAFARTSAFDDIDSPARVRAAHGRWWVRFSRGELDAARRLAQDMRSRGEHSGDAMQRVTGLCATGMTLAMCGELTAARGALEAALEERAACADAASAGPFVQEPGVEAGGVLALVSWIAGDFAAARTHAARAVDLAVALRHPLSEVTALYMAASVHALAGEFDVVETLIGRLHEVIERHALSTTSSGFDWLHGRALLARGNVDEGLAQMRRAAEGARRCGLRVTYDGFHYHHAEACRIAGQLDAAESSAREGLALASESGARLLESGLWRQLALTLAAKGDAAGAESAGRQAVAAARTQGAVFHEVMALAAAREQGWRVEEPARLGELLAGGLSDPSPSLAAARACAA